LTTLVAGVGLAFLSRRSLRTTIVASKSPSNVLEWPLVGGLLRSRWFLTLLIVPTLLVFAGIIASGLLGEQNTSNPAVLLTWLLWWPAVIFTFLLVGRLWCAMCPFGWLGDVAQKMFSLRLKPPRILKNMWWRLGLFLALTWATTLWALDRSPFATAGLALSITLGAVALALIYEKRTFCRYVCPLGGVFGLYAQTAPARLDVKDKNICQQECADKNCYKACSWFQFPPTLERNAECSLCLDCVRACPHDNIALRIQPSGSDLAQFQPRRKSLDEAATVAAVLGVSLLQTAVMLNGWSDWEARVGSWLGLAPGAFLYTLVFISVGVVLPLALLVTVAYLSVSLGRGARADVWKAARIYAYGFLPLGLALHAAHNFHHLFGEGAAMWNGVKRAALELTGWASLAALPDTTFSPSPNSLFVLQWVALMGGLYLGIQIAVAAVRRSSPPQGLPFRAVLPLLVFAVGYTVGNLLLLSSAMGHRH
jgi:ferredoxin